MPFALCVCVCVCVCVFVRKIKWTKNILKKCKVLRYPNLILHYTEYESRYTVEYELCLTDLGFFSVILRTINLHYIYNYNYLNFLCICPWSYSSSWQICFTLILLTWRIWWAPNNASSWQMGFNSAFYPYPANVENMVSS